MKNSRKINGLVDDTFYALKHKGVDVAKRCFEGIGPLIALAPENIKQSFSKTLKTFDHAVTLEMIDGYVGLFAKDLRKKRVGNKRLHACQRSAGTAFAKR